MIDGDTTIYFAEIHEVEVTKTIGGIPHRKKDCFAPFSRAPGAILPAIL